MHVLCGTKSVNDIFTSICNCYWIGQVKRFLIKGLVRPKIYVSIFFSCASISFFIVVKLAPIRFCTVILELILLWYRFMYFLIFFWGGGYYYFIYFALNHLLHFLSCLSILSYNQIDYWPMLYENHSVKWMDCNVV